MCTEGRTLHRLAGSTNARLSKDEQRLAILNLHEDNIKAITGVGRTGNAPDVALSGPRAIPEAHPTIRGNWNLGAVTNPVHDVNEGKTVLHGPRSMPTSHRTISNDWNMMTIINPVRRANGGNLHLHGPMPIPSPTPAPQPISAPKIFDPRPPKPFYSEPLIRQEVKSPAPPTASEAHQHTHPDQIPLPPIPFRPIRTGRDPLRWPRLTNATAHEAPRPDQIPPLPIAYRPILAGRHPLRRPLPPIPTGTYPEEDTNCQPPLVPPHVELPRRKAIAMHAYNDPEIPVERCLPAPEAPVGPYFGRVKFPSGYQSPRCETVFSE